MWICPDCERDVRGGVCPECGRAYHPEVSVTRLQVRDGTAFIKMDFRAFGKALRAAQKRIERRMWVDEEL